MRRIGYGWNLRQIMATRGMHQTSDLMPALAERGVRLSREQVYRLVTQVPQRMNLDVLFALCDIFECTVEDLAAPTVEAANARKSVNGAPEASAARNLKPAGRSVLRRPGEPR